MKVLIFKQPTFYKNQIGTRSQLCNSWNHRQKQLIQWMVGLKDLQAHTRQPVRAQRLWRAAEITAELKLWTLLGAPSVCKPILSSTLLQCSRLFLFLHSFRNWESTPLWGHISQCRGHKKSGITNDRKLIKNQKCDESRVLQAVTSLEPWLWTHNIYISDCICSSYDVTPCNINKSSQTITTTHTRRCLPLSQKTAGATNIFQQSSARNDRLCLSLNLAALECLVF